MRSKTKGVEKNRKSIVETFAGASIRQKNKSCSADRKIV
jgi:hypothetical protein